ncbi:hypothetical protein H0H87_009757 [Tephrocybe sp. NHM501043]|nr:hypothetical protein H0H87_009757 [Tephrocybe sp. NHM501043]
MCIPLCIIQRNNVIAPTVIMNDHFDGLDLALPLADREPLSTPIVGHSSTTLTPSYVPISPTFSFATTPASALYRPSPPHIALPSHIHPLHSGTDQSRLGAGVIVGIILGVLALTLAGMGTIVYFCFQKSSRDREAEGKWQDLEKKDAATVPKPHYEKARKYTEWDALPNYTEYVSRSEGKQSPIPKTYAPMFGRIKEHHNFPDPFVDSKTLFTRKDLDMLPDPLKAHHKP